MTDPLADFDLTPETTAIRGFWLDLGSRVEKDSGWVRIEWLLQNRLELVKESDSEIGSLYRNPVDNSFWHYWLVAPQMSGGGPPALDRITAARAAELFS